jgi:hypothetical protein
MLLEVIITYMLSSALMDSHFILEKVEKEDGAIMFSAPSLVGH